MSPGPNAATCAFSCAQIASACFTNCAVEIAAAGAERVDGVVLCLPVLLLLPPQAARPTLTRPASPITRSVGLRIVRGVPCVRAVRNVLKYSCDVAHAISHSI